MKKGKTKRRSRSFTLPVAVVAGFMPGVVNPINHWRWHGFNGFTRELSRVWLGWDPEEHKFTGFSTWAYGLFPAVGGILVHKFIGGKLGINRALAAAKVPWIRL